MSQHEPNPAFVSRGQHNPADLKRDNANIQPTDHKTTELLFNSTRRNHFARCLNEPSYRQFDLSSIREHLQHAWSGNTEEDRLARYTHALQALAPDLSPADIESHLVTWEQEKRLSNLIDDYTRGLLSTENFEKLRHPKLLPRVCETKPAIYTQQDIAPSISPDLFEAELKKVSLANAEKEALKKKLHVGTQSSGHGIA